MVRARAAVVMILFSIGCGAEPVREDRAADWSRGGDNVAFQHDQEGVYVAGKDGQGLTRIFEPDASVLATSRPLYCPTDGRLIFTTAYDPNGRPREDGGRFPSPADGRTVHQRPVKYTCWIRDEASGENQPPPRELFSASCEHVGYISAGLAVRWHPDGHRVLFVDAGPAGDHRHGVREFDLATSKIRTVFPHRADAVIFDFTPRGSYLVCVAGFAGDPNDGARIRADVAGIWIGDPDDGKSWWKAPGTERLAAGELPSLIEGLRASRPAWTSDDRQFASVASNPTPGHEQSPNSLLQVTRVATRDVQSIHEIEGTIADLHWSRDGSKLGFVERSSTGNGTLRIHEAEGTLSDPIGNRPVRRFAGFDGTGSRLAYVVADEVGLPESGQEWTFVLPPDRLARDTVVVSETVDVAQGRDVFSGMRVTFPVWSPHENRLSLWITFEPRYRSLFSFLFRWGLWPGDPAATLDLTTGEIAWMAVSPAEELQVGHYYLLKKDYTRAWEWYEKANAKLPARRAPRDLGEFVNTIGAPERSQLFEYHCLKELGRDADAAAKLLNFEQTFFPAPDPAGDQVARVIDDIVRQFGEEGELLKQLLHDLYVAEVFLSIDAPDAGISLLQEQIANAGSETQRLSGSLAQAQVLLAAGRREEYLKLCSAQIFPLVCESWQADAAARGPARNAANNGPAARFVLPIVGNLTLLPAAFPDFLAGISDEAVRDLVAIWEAKRRQMTEQHSALATDLFLRAAHLKLGNLEQSRECESRITANPESQATFGGKTVAGALHEFRENARQFGTPGQFPVFGAANVAPPSR